MSCAPLPGHDSWPPPGGAKHPGSVRSLDARWRPSLRSETLPAWNLWLLRFQMSVVYLYGGIAKIQADWLQGYPMRLWMPTRDEIPCLGALAQQVDHAIC